MNLPGRAPGAINRSIKPINSSRAPRAQRNVDNHIGRFSPVRRSNSRRELRALPPWPAALDRGAPVRGDREDGRPRHGRRLSQHAARVHGADDTAGRGPQHCQGLPRRQPHPRQRLRQDKPEPRLVRRRRLLSALRRGQLGGHRHRRGNYFILFSPSINCQTKSLTWFCQLVKLVAAAPASGI